MTIIKCEYRLNIVMILMSISNLPFVEACLKGKNCNDCPTCQADAESWHQLEQDFSEGKSFTLDLQLYYQVKAKRKIFLQEKNGEYVTISEPEMLNMLSRY